MSQLFAFSGFSRIHVEPPAEKGFVKALQGQEAPNLKDTSPLNNDCETVEIPNGHAAFQIDDRINMSCSPVKLRPETWASPLALESRIGLSSDTQNLHKPYRVFPPPLYKNDDIMADLLKKHDLAPENKANLHMSPLSLMHSSPSLNLLGSRTVLPAKVDKKQPQIYVPYSAFAEDLNSHTTHQSNSPFMQQLHASNSGGSCKLFGISLTRGSVAGERATTASGPLEQVNLDLDRVQSPKTNLIKEGSKLTDVAGTCDEPGKVLDSSEQTLRDKQGNQQAGFRRSCVKVIHQPYNSTLYQLASDLNR